MTINALDGHQHGAVDDVRLFSVRSVPHLGDDQRLGVRDPIGEQPLHWWRRIQKSGAPNSGYSPLPRA
jgi:hypothetical protein